MTIKGTIQTFLVTALLLGGCASNPPDSTGKALPETASLILNTSFLREETKQQAAKPTSEEHPEETQDPKTYTPLRPIEVVDAQPPEKDRLIKGLSETPTITVAAEGLSPVQFVHYVFGELLGLNYIIDETVKADSANILLNVQEKISPQRLFALSLDLLQDNNITVYESKGLYFVKAGANPLDTVIGIGRSPEDVPSTSREVLQIVPVTFGTRISTERTINQLLDIQILPDAEQNAFFLRGSRAAVIRALELINLLDTPANRGRYIGILELTYIDPESLLQQLKTLLTTEGIEVNEANGQAIQKNVALVPLPRLGATAVFATSEVLIDRIRYWAEILDKPAKGANKRYFTYTPRNARAADIFDSLSGLFGTDAPQEVSSSVQTQTRTTLRNPLRNTAPTTTGNAPTRGRTNSMISDALSLVVDERSNALVLYCTGEEYQTLEPLLERLDILPKQVLLDVMIAEVTLQGEFRLGVEWALRQNGINYTTQGAFGATSFAGLALAVSEDAGALNATMFASNSLVNIVSNPTMLVRDGISASINVGSDIAVIGNTTIDPIIGQRQTVATEYRKTGVNVTITPTINATDVVIMDVTQAISNTVPGSSGAAGNPDIFERTLQTQVVAKSGQTIMLGGLISEDKSTSDQGIPFLKEIPLLGNLAKGQNRSSQKTELVMLITAKVIDSPEIWEEVNAGFLDGLEAIQIRADGKNNE